MPTRGARYTPKEAEGRIPILALRVARDAQDLVLALEKYPIGSHEIEHRIWALLGEVGFLGRLCHVIWKYEALERATRSSAI